MTLKNLAAVAVLTLGGCATGEPAGPTGAELAAAIEQVSPQMTLPVRIATPTLKLERCRAFEHEPTQFRCEFQAQEVTGAWKTVSATVTYDGGRWVLLDME